MFDQVLISAEILEPAHRILSGKYDLAIAANLPSGYLSVNTQFKSSVGVSLSHTLKGTHICMHINPHTNIIVGIHSRNQSECKVGG